MGEKIELHENNHCPVCNLKY